MKKIEARIVADSINSHGDRITSLLLTFPRFILPELNTHRVFSKNSASSRAIPAVKMIQMIKDDPFIPYAWQKNHTGMQGTEYFTNEDSIKYRKEAWIIAKDNAIRMANKLNNAQNVTKQITNRLLEPFMWHTVLLTGTNFGNFFELRCPKYEVSYRLTDESLYDAVGTAFSRKIAIEADPSLESLTDLDWIMKSESQAEIHMQLLAEAMYDAIYESEPIRLEDSQWHLPMVKEAEINSHDINDVKKMSVARCARLSYATFDNEIDIYKDIQLHDKLLKSKHMSPFEHQAKAMTSEEYKDNYVVENGSKLNGKVANFKGFIQYRKYVE